ncbi:MAG: DUF726 domain-containing protein [Ilumatobacteraceae bacterium]
MAALGCTLGASVTNACAQDKSFHIEMLQGGAGTAVIVCNGFLTEGDVGWGEWRAIITQRYPDSPIYRVHWGAKELRDLSAMLGSGAVKAAGPAAIKSAAVHASKAAVKKLAPIAPALVAGQLAKNPWHVAKNRANKTGVVIADLLARTEASSYVLVGHSLGARAMVFAAQTLSTKADGPRLEAVHLLGAAIRGKGDWESLTARVDDAVYNYHSTHDDVLRYAYKIAEVGHTAAGLSGFTPPGPKLKNIDVSDCVDGHSAYLSNVTSSSTKLGRSIERRWSAHRTMLAGRRRARDQLTSQRQEVVAVRVARSRRIESAIVATVSQSTAGRAASTPASRSRAGRLSDRWASGRRTVGHTK